MNITMKQLAHDLGISRTTVSLILKGEADRYRISASTRDKVLAAIKSAGFKPSYLATALSSRKTGVIGVVLPNIMDDFLSSMLQGVEGVLHDAGYMIMLCTSRYDTAIEKKNIEQLLYRRVDGMLVVFNAPFAGEPWSTTHLKQLVRQQPCTVFIDRHLPGLAAARVTLDDHAGAYNATVRMLRTAKRPVFITLDLNVSTVHERLAGFKKACMEKKVSLSPWQIVKIGRSMQDDAGVTGIVSALFKQRRQPDAILIANGRLTSAVSAACIKAGFIPGKTLPMARFGLDPVSSATGIDCIDLCHVKMGETAARILIDCINGVKKPGSPETIVALDAA